MVLFRATATYIHMEACQRYLGNRLQNKLHPMVSEHPFAQIDRQQQRLIRVSLNKILHAD